MNLNALKYAGLTACLATALHAGTVTLDANVANGVYFGTGNSNGHFTVDTETNGIEIGLRAASPFVGPLTPTGSVYTAQAGLADPSAAPTAYRALWNYEFSVDLGTGFSFAGPNAVHTLFTISGPGGSNTPFDLVLIPDNAKVGTTGIQNSENPAFGSRNPLSAAYGLLASTAFDSNAVGLYSLNLSVLDGNNTVLATDSIQVNVITPEPATFAMIGGGLTLLALVRRRRQ